MERYYSTLKNLPTELLSSNLASKSTSLDEIKYYRWITRDTFLQISQSPFAQANGIGSDHLYNFLDLQDALIVKMLIKKLEDLELKEEDVSMDSDKEISIELNTENIRTCALIQLILSESPKLIEFLFAYPAQSIDSPSLKLTTLKFLIHSCPAIFNCTHLFKDFIHMDSYREDKFYYWNFVILLMEKYPTQATFELAKEVVTEIDLYYDDFICKNELDNIRNIVKIISKVFPMIDLSPIKNIK